MYIYMYTYIYVYTDICIYIYTRRDASIVSGCASGVCVCCFVLLNRYWGIVTVPGSFLKAGDLGWPDPYPPP